MYWIVRLLITAVLVTILDFFMPKIEVDTFTTALLVALVLGLLNLFIKPIVVFFTLPVTVLTLGLFMLVINALMILLCTAIVGGFEVKSFWSAVWFSLILSFSQTILFRLLSEDK